jgi:hypothetical protein
MNLSVEQCETNHRIADDLTTSHASSDRDDAFAAHFLKIKLHRAGAFSIHLFDFLMPKRQIRHDELTIRVGTATRIAVQVLAARPPLPGPYRHFRPAPPAGPRAAFHRLLHPTTTRSLFRYLAFEINVAKATSSTSAAAVVDIAPSVTTRTVLNVSAAGTAAGRLLR